MRVHALKVAAASVLLAAGLSIPFTEAPLRGQSAVSAVAEARPLASRAIGFAVSSAARNLPPAAAPEPGPDRDRPRDRTIPNREMPKAGRPVHPEDGLDLARQPLYPEPLMPAPVTGFEGLNNANNLAAFGSLVNPPDTNGDVGPAHYVQQTNLLVRVYSKAGAPMTAPFKLSALFAPLGGVCAADDDGDPVVLYDPLADRWLLSQFGIPSSSPFRQCIAVSQTGNPAGAYYLYDFVMPNANFPDYPKLGVWPDAYYMTTVQFLGSSFNGSGAFAFDRVKMLAGDPTAGLIYFDLNLASHPEGIGGLLPADLDGLTPPPAAAPNPMAYFTATEFGDPADALRLFDFHADFASPASSTFVERAGSPLAVAAFNPISPSGRKDIPQPGVAPPQFLDAISDRLMHRLQYRNRGSSESLVVTHTVDADPAASFRAGIRYYELRNTGAGSAFLVNEQATYSPDTTHRWMGSAAADHAGNLAVGYSVSSAAVFPGIRYAGRLATDPPGGLFQGEATLIGGSGVQTSTSSRWGDYSALTVDPTDDCTFWYTTEYYTAASQATSTIGWLTRIGSFKFPSCTPRPVGSVTVNVTACSDGAPVASALVHLNAVAYGVTQPSGTFRASVDPASYSLTATKAGLGSASTSVSVDPGEDVVVDLCLGSSSTNVDLIVSTVKAPSKGAAGGSVTVKYNLQNLGTSGAGSTTTGIYLSANAALDGADVLLGTDVAAPIAGGATIAEAVTVVIPPGTASGPYYFIVLADSLNDEAETDEGNNTRAIRVNIGPDLVVSALSVTPGSVAAGGTVTISETTKNSGGASTGTTTTTQYYLSLDRNVSSGDDVLGAHAVPILARGASHSSSLPFSIPAGKPPGTYYVIAVADDGNAVHEYNERNNRKTFLITVF